MRLLVFVHFDKHGLLDPHVLFSLKTYRHHFDRIVFVSPSLRACPTEARPFIDRFVPRDNVGYDFCSWKDGLAGVTDYDDVDEVFFLNDSVYGPLFNPSQALKMGKKKGCDFWGMVLSNQSPDGNVNRLRLHVQSWFFATNNGLHRSGEFQSFWSSVKPLPSKFDIIDQFEVGMTERILTAGYTIGGLFDIREAPPPDRDELRKHCSFLQPQRSIKHRRRAQARTYNPSEMRVDKLWELGVPYLKSSVFRHNNYYLDTKRLLRHVAKNTDYDVSLIKNHLARIEN